MNRLLLPGLDGGNPLAFLAALGTFRALTRVCPRVTITMAWNHSPDGWRPVLHSVPLNDKEVVVGLLDQCRQTAVHPTLTIADNLTISADSFRQHALQQAMGEDAGEGTAYVSAFGSDAIAEDDTIVDTALRTMSGAGHQHFLKTMRDVLSSATDEQLRRTLFEAWDYADPLQGRSLRLDPLDDKRYALQWSDPSGDPTRTKRGNMIGANALAVLGMPFISVAPCRDGLQTTGFRGRRSADCFWTWPIWTCALTPAVTTSLLALDELQDDAPPIAILARLGVAEIYRSQRITTGKFRNFTPAVPVSSQ